MAKRHLKRDTPLWRKALDWLDNPANKIERLRDWFIISEEDWTCLCNIKRLSDMVNLTLNIYG